MSETITITGGKKLSGEITPVPNKNSILPALCASILTDKPVIFKNVPKSTDVLKILEMLKLLGADVKDEDFNNLTVCCKNLSSYKVDKELGNLIRSSIMFVGPLLTRFCIAEVPVPGGCVLGKRSISAHVDSFSQVGVEIEYLENDYVRFKTPKNILDKYVVWQFEASVTATENLIMYAGGTDAQFTITDAACEPHVEEVTEMVRSMGAEISGAGSNVVTIKGTNKLSGCTFVPGPDPIDIGGIIVAAGITKGNVLIKGANIQKIVGGLVGFFEKFGIKIERIGNDLRINGDVELYADSKNSGFPLAGDQMPKIAPRPWPGPPVDLLPVFVTLACKNKGKILIQNWMYETGLDFVNELNSIGANIFTADPQRIIVYGPVKFIGGKVTPPAIIQSCKAIFLAGLADPVSTTVVGVDILKRRYPDIIKNYQQLGADINLA